jgi:uncharacterized protein YjbK
MQRMSDIVLESIKSKKIETIYGTCSEKRLNAYVRIGFVKIDELIFFGEKKYLLELDAANAAKLGI